MNLNLSDIFCRLSLILKVNFRVKISQKMNIKFNVMIIPSSHRIFLHQTIHISHGRRTVFHTEFFKNMLKMLIYSSWAEL